MNTNLTPQTNTTRPEQALSHSDLLDSFYRDVKIKEDGFGVEVNCRLGLWSVSAPTMEQAIREAQHYYLQYQRDGEYGAI